MSSICKNCNNPTNEKYCGKCGQSTHIHDIDFSSFMHDLQHTILHVDRGIIYTTKELFSRPGYSIREFIEGKRVRHFKPVAYILILSTVYAVAMKMANKDTFIGSFLEGLNNGFTDGVGNGDFIKVTKVIMWMVNNYAYSTLMLLPLFSFASYIIFRKQGENYFKHLVLNCYVAGQNTIAYFVLLLCHIYVTNQNINDIVQILMFISGVMLTAWTYIQFFDKLPKHKVIFNTLITYMMYCFLFLALFTVLAVLITFIGIYIGATKNP
jgi:hypothetical protein